MGRKVVAREAILRAAEAVVVEAGLVHLTLDAVAAKAGVSKGGLLYHFPSKEALLQGMVAHLLADCDHRIDKMHQEIGQDAGADLEAYIRTGFQPQKKQQRISAGLLAAGVTNPKLLDPVRKWHVRNYLGMARTKRNPIRAALIIMAMDGVWLNELMQTSPLNAKEREELMKEMIDFAKLSV